jgi:hypothetical protein
MQRRRTKHARIRIDGITYFSAMDVQREIGVVRQTLWRWRRARKIPAGRRYRDRQVVFTREEVDAIRKYANRLVPADASGVDQAEAHSSTPRARSGRRIARSTSAGQQSRRRRDEESS